MRSALEGNGAWIFLLVMGIMLLQWMLEAVKWKIMLKHLHAVSFFSALRMVFSGIAFSIATPNRMGEFAGRVMHLPSGKRLTGSAFTVIGNFAQLIVTCMAGSIALSMEMHDQHIQPTLKGMANIQLILFGLTPLALLVFLLVYFKAGSIFHWIMSFRILNRFREGISAAESISNAVLLKVLMLSCFRFILFMVQYWLLFDLANTGIDFRDTCVAVSIMLLWLAVVPTFTLLELGLRWEFALLLMAPLTNNVLGIAFVITAVWLINLILPAAIGSVVLLFYRKR